MAEPQIKRGDRVLARTAFNAQVERRALSGPTMGDDFLVVRVCTHDEWDAAESDGREPRSTPWPAEDVELLIAEAEQRITERVAELDRAEAEGRLREAVEAVPSIDEQLRPLARKRKA